VGHPLPEHSTFFEQEPRWVHGRSSWCRHALSQWKNDPKLTWLGWNHILSLMPLAQTLRSHSLEESRNL
jgi:hypothetical protein